MSTKDFSRLADIFHHRVERIVWATVATQDEHGRLRARLLHPVWEKPTKGSPLGWILTGRNSLKARHIERNPYVSITYWDPQHEQAYIDARVSWLEGAEDKVRAWKLVESLPEPYGYQPAMFWPDGPSSSDFGVLEIRPWRVEVSTLAGMVKGEKPLIWRE